MEWTNISKNGICSAKAVLVFGGSRFFISIEVSRNRKIDDGYVEVVKDCNSSVPKQGKRVYLSFTPAEQFFNYHFSDLVDATCIHEMYLKYISLVQLYQTKTNYA